MNNLQILNENGKLVVSSREVSENFGKRHDNVVLKINAIITSWTKDTALKNKVSKYFIEDTYKDESGKSNKQYLLSRDGFSFVVMGFTGRVADVWKTKYIEAFNEMERTLINGQPKLSQELQAIFVIDKRSTETNLRMDKLENDMPLFNIDCKELQALVRKIGIKSLGGYKTPAYQDNSLRGKVYADIQGQLKRQFGITRYEAIKRSQIDSARGIVSDYILPLYLQDDITLLNNQTTLKGVNI
ncbi:ORF6C domain-containing protein [Clostridium estertheticum]|uniref:ORF6C domain-containing protein n=1 Tax=Clostridium estertheticum subsp. estertheticum TaxID=1552 RepID=A0A1J0GJM5_9CLOT|nr:ORF6C domain-containing protein [Clostridium estertheticum]APC41557.1 hypothetical protein A7L45_16465 [Clostridium estertheticum subsp. estertheticum]